MSKKSAQGVWCVHVCIGSSDAQGAFFVPNAVLSLTQPLAGACTRNIQSLSDADVPPMAHVPVCKD
jgi:hypothetical protein